MVIDTSIFTTAFHSYDIWIALLSFLVGRFTKANAMGVALLLRVSILLIKMAKHFYDTHPQARNTKRSTTLDNQVASLYKQHVIPNEKRLMDSHETKAEG